MDARPVSYYTAEARQSRGLLMVAEYERRAALDILRSQNATCLLQTANTCRCPANSNQTFITNTRG
jgi:hypothetical protein